MRNFWEIQRSQRQPVEVRSSVALTDITKQINTQDDKRCGSIVRNIARETKSDSDIVGTGSNPETVAQSRLFLTRKSRIALAIGVGMVATVTAGGMAMAGGRGFENVNEQNNAEIRPTLYVDGVNPVDDGLTGRVIEMEQSDSNFELLPLSPPLIQDYLPMSKDLDAYTTQDFDKMMEEHVHFQEHDLGQTYSLLRLDVWSSGRKISHDLEYRMIEPEGDSMLSANVRKFEILKENIIRFYPKLKNCTIRTDFGKPGSFQSPVLEFKVASVLKPKNLSNRTMYEIMPNGESEILKRITHYGDDALLPDVGHLGFSSPSASTIGQHWAIVVSRTDVVPGYFPFAKLTEKSYRILEDLIPETKPEHQYKMCLSFIDL